MDCVELISLIEECYDRMCRRGKILCWNVSGVLSTNPPEVIDFIRSLGMRASSEVTTGARVATLSLLVNGPITVFHDDNQLVLFGALLTCRVFSALRRFSCEEKYSFILHKNILDSLGVIKEWIIGFFSSRVFAEIKFPLEQRSIVQTIQSLLNENQLLNKKYCLDLAHVLVISALQKKRLFFVPKDEQRDMVYSSFGSSGSYLDNVLFFDRAVLLPVSLSLEAEYLLFDLQDRGGNIVLFSCSLLIEGDELEKFVILLRSIQIRFVASQRVLGEALKEILFEMDIIPLERLSTQHIRLAQAVTEATPFHSVCEFILWMESMDLRTENVNVHIGEVHKILVVEDGRFWLYGKGNVATIVVPVKNPFVQNSILKCCEQASRSADRMICGLIMESLTPIGMYEAFFAEYLYHCYILYKEKNRYLRDLVHILRFTLTSHALNVGLPANASLHLNFLEVSKRVMNHVSFASGSYPHRKKRYVTDLKNYIPTAEPGKYKKLCRCAELICSAIDNASLLFRVNESI